MPCGVLDSTHTPLKVCYGTHAVRETQCPKTTHVVQESKLFGSTILAFSKSLHLDMDLQWSGPAADQGRYGVNSAITRCYQTGEGTRYPRTEPDGLASWFPEDLNKAITFQPCLAISQVEGDHLVTDQGGNVERNPGGGATPWACRALSLPTDASPKDCCLILPVTGPYDNGHLERNHKDRA